MSDLLTTVLPIAIILIGVLQVSWILKLRKWAKKLKKREATNEEGIEVLYDIKNILWIPNHPRYWGYCKQIYYGIIHSNEVEYDIKMKAFNKFDRLKVHGIRAPRKTTSAN